MAKCAACKKTILFGGKTSREYRFCNDKCAQYAPVLHTADELSNEEVDKVTEVIHKGVCPMCNKSKGVVDVHTSYHVWSAIFISSWKDVPEVSCKSCASKRQIGAFISSFFLGWWGFPHGLVATPIQLVKNIAGILGGPSITQPSEDLKRTIRLQMATQKVIDGQENRVFD